MSRGTWIQPQHWGSSDGNGPRSQWSTTKTNIHPFAQPVPNQPRFNPLPRPANVPSQISLVGQEPGHGSQIDAIRQINLLQGRPLSPSLSSVIANPSNDSARSNPDIALNRQEAYVTPPSSTACTPEPSSVENYMPRMDPKVEDLVAILERIFADREKYKQLLSCPKPAAQKLLDIFQHLLDILVPSRPKFRGDLIVAAQRLAGRSGLYPVSFELKSITTVGEYSITNGAFADVYTGTLQNHSVCLKTIRLDQKTDVQQFLKACSKEAILWSQLSHPNLLPFYGIYRFRNRLSLVSPWMENGNITTYLQEHSSANRVLLALDVAQGLQYLHHNGIVHGDLKGPNILVNRLGRACLADFGLSSISDPEILAWTTQSSAASTGGSVRWQAPELFDPESDEDIQNTIFSDVYAWACVVYEIFTGRIPFSHLTRDTAVSLKVRNGERPSRPEDSSFSWTAWGLTKDIWALIEAGWTADPASRPTVKQIVERLDSEMRKNYVAADDQIQLNTKGDENCLSAAQFRALACEGSDVVEISAQALEMLLNAK